MVTFHDVLYVPELVANLLSSEALRLKGLFYRNDTHDLFMKDGTTVAEVQVHHGLPHLRINNSTVCKSDTALISSKQLSTSTATPAEWHRRLGHLRLDNIRKAAQNSSGMIVKGEASNQQCSDCQKAIAKRIVSRVPSQIPRRPYTEVSTDVVHVTDIGIIKERYFSMFTDATTLYIHQYTTATKDGVKHHFKRHHAYVRTQLDVTVQAYRMDGGREYGGNSLHDFARSEGINLKITTPHNWNQTAAQRYQIISTVQLLASSYYKANYQKDYSRTHSNAPCTFTTSHRRTHCKANHHIKCLQNPKDGLRQYRTSVT
jgi:hypothetical protein